MRCSPMFAGLASAAVTSRLDPAPSSARRDTGQCAPAVLQLQRLSAAGSRTEQRANRSDLVELRSRARAAVDDRYCLVASLARRSRMVCEQPCSLTARSSSRAIAMLAVPRSSWCARELGLSGRGEAGVESRPRECGHDDTL